MTGVLPDTKSLALIVYDPDAPDPVDPKMIWVHWMLYNLPRKCSGVPFSVKVNQPVAYHYFTLPLASSKYSLFRISRK